MATEACAIWCARGLQGPRAHREQSGGANCPIGHGVMRDKEEEPYLTVRTTFFKGFTRGTNTQGRWDREDGDAGGFKVKFLKDAGWFVS